MRIRIVLALAFSFLVGTGASHLQAQAAGPDENPTANTGALKAQIETGGSYDAPSGNATRIIPDLHLPGALWVYGLDFVRYWNSLRNDRNPGDEFLHPEPEPDQPTDFGSPGWSHSWSWSVSYDEYLQEPLDDVGPEIYTMMLTITFPDGHASKYKITRSNQWVWGQPWAPDPRFGPPYIAWHGEANWSPSGEIHDYLENMAEDGSEFWLYRSDGGSVHFINDNTWGYQAREVLDPHGLLTTLYYDGNGHLYQVQQDGGRRLILYWNSGVITRVENPDSSPVQAVDYGYSWFNGGLTLTSAIYHDEPAPGQTTSSTYTYQTYTAPSGFFYAGPLLSSADDPHFAGPMRSISYDYRGSGCLPTQKPAPGFEPYAGAQFDYLYASPTAIAAEKNLGTQTTVSSFVIGCFDGTRTEYNGLGGFRKFFYGRSAGEQGSFHCLGFQLAKLTDFTNVYPLPSDLPFERQNYLSGEPRQIWDGRGILTETVYGDSSGLPSEVHHTGSDGSVSSYDRFNPGSSDAQDFSRIPNPYSHWLFSKTDERYQTTTYRRDSRRRVTDIYYPVTSEHFVYNEFNQVTSHTLPSGAVVTYEYYPGSHLLRWEYNSIDGPDSRKEYTYDGLNRVATVSDARSRSSGAPYSTWTEYNGRHQAIIVHYAPTNGGDPTVRYAYDRYGNCISITDELGHTKSYEYDDYRRCISYTEALNATDGNGNPIASRRWDWLYDRWIVGLGPRDQYAHTKNEWRIQIGPAFNYLYERPMTARAHDLQNRIIIEQTGWIQPGNQPIGYWYPSPDLETHYFGYDANGQKSIYVDPLGRQTTYDYDLRNRLWKTNETVNTIPRTTETLYDPTGNKTLVTFPDTRTQQWLDYDAFGQPGRFIDERGNTTNLTYIWGPMKKLYTVTTHRDGDWGGTEDQRTWFSYDPMGKPTQVLFPDGSHEDTTYQCTGAVGYLCEQPHTWTTRKGQKKTITYDARGREIYHEFDDGQTPLVYRYWDDASRMTHISNSMADIYFDYDDAAQLKSESDYIAGAATSVTTSYRRYATGSIWNIIYPNGLWVARDYTARGQFNMEWENSPGSWRMAVDYNYNADGKVDYQDYGNGVRSNYDYDARGYINWVQHYRTSPYQNYSARTYWRDDRDRITAWQKSTDNSINPMEDGRGNHYSYDAEGELTDAYYGAVDPAGNPNSWQREDHFNLDALGNRRGWDYVQTKGWQNFTRKDNGLNEYRMWSPYSIINYDDDIGGTWGSPGHANGVIMQDGWITGGYNALNQPMYIWSANVGWTYFGYDPLGRCVKRWSDNGSVSYLYYDGWDLIQDGPQSSVADRTYVHGARVDEIVAQITPANNWIRYFHYDANGNCTLQTDGWGNMVEQYDYDAFGFPYFYDAWGNNIGYSPWGNRMLFTGRDWLKDLKLYDYRNRLYNPELGRFMQPDPKEFAAGDYNLYRYCHNDPVNRTDPMGLAYVSSMTSQGGGDWISGMSGLTNRDKDLINQARLSEFLYSNAVQAAARKDATYSHSTNVEYGAAFANTKSNPNDIAAGPMTPSTEDVARNPQGTHGVMNQTDFAKKPLPPGHERLIGGHWGLARYERGFPYGDKHALWSKHWSGVLGVPVPEGQHGQPTVHVYQYDPSKPEPRMDDP